MTALRESPMLRKNEGKDNDQDLGTGKGDKRGKTEQTGKQDCVLNTQNDKKRDCRKKSNEGSRDPDNDGSIDGVCGNLCQFFSCEKTVWEKNVRVRVFPICLP